MCDIINIKILLPKFFWRRAMSKYKQSLKIFFDSKDETVLYNGVCYYRKNLLDKINITRNAIEIFFERSKKDKPDELLNTQNSIIRFYMQKALCFYLVVEGSFPKVNKIRFTCNEQSYLIEHENFTHYWENMRVPIRLKQKVAQIIFESAEGKQFYIMMTYFLKAQLDIFSHDCFRSAWSSLNCLYTYIDKLNHEGYRSENNKLSTLSKIIEDNTMPESLKKIDSLGMDDFWTKLNWYNIFSRYSLKEFNRFMSNPYKDHILLDFYCKYQPVFIEEIQLEEKAWEKLKKTSLKETSVPKDRLKFLICKYCYHIRNRSFHAERAYPLFVISEDVETRIENSLTELILLTIKDLFEVYVNKTRLKAK